MTLVVAILAAIVGAVVYGYAINRRARREIEQNVDEQTAATEERALESEKSKSDDDALAAFRKNFSDGGKE